MRYEPNHSERINIPSPTSTSMSLVHAGIQLGASHTERCNKSPGRTPPLDDIFRWIGARSSTIRTIHTISYDLVRSG
eukprot:2476565-Prymnesium_polylepis.1